jgi:phosphomannomutase / phosphoglucomutase
VTTISEGIFKAYDIRGIVATVLTEPTVERIGNALGQLARERGSNRCAVGRDGRLSSPMLAQAVIRGLRGAGIDVLDIGLATTPMLYLAAHELTGGTGIQITGSHNPPEYNGMKMMVAGTTLYGDDIQRLRTGAEAAAVGAAARGQFEQREIFDLYQKRVVADIKLTRPISIALDAGNGVAGAFAPKLFRALGCQVTELFCEVDGNFPNHHPDPAHPENLEDLIHAVAKGNAELGFAFDGDGDRLGVVTKDGQIIWPDRQLMLFAKDVLASRPGSSIIYDVKCSRHVAEVVRAAGGQPLMWRTGHSLIKAKLKETQAPLAGEMSGHVFFNDRWPGFDDGMYAGARLLEILTRSRDPSAVLNALPQSRSTPELHIQVAEGENHAIVAAMQKSAKFPDATEVITIDGLRVEFADGFGLVRASNTTPVLVCRFEAETDAALARIQQQLAQAVRAIKPQAKIPW